MTNSGYETHKLNPSLLFAYLWQALFSAVKKNDAEGATNILKSKNIDIKQPNRNKVSTTFLFCCAFYAN